ncbi:MAG: hypothetical protein VR75_00260 [Hyphomonadaceae bacterium BRH_c29]|nr:MAG: hypothetical protein VR75_00260 [Hyphomonadaceae bacterium BRH_c29]
MRIVLHIGLEKTGTTAAQAYWSQNFDRNQERGVWYSKSLGRPLHTRLVVYASRDFLGPVLETQYGISDETSYQEFRTKTEADLENELRLAREAGCSHFLISHEFFHSKIRNTEDIERVADLLKRLGESVEVLCVLRRPADLFASTMNEFVRAKYPLEPDIINTVDPKNNYYDFADLLGNWCEQLGADNVHIISFHRAPGQNVLNALNEYLGLDTDIPRDAGVRNESVDIRTLAIGNAVRSPRIVDNLLNPNLEFFMDELPFESKLSLGNELTEELNRRFEESNRKLLSLFPECLVETDLLAEVPDYDGNFEKLFELKSYSPWLTYMVERFNRQIWYERARHALLEVQFAKAQGRPEDAAEAASRTHEFIVNAQGIGLEKVLMDLSRKLEYELPP